MTHSPDPRTTGRHAHPHDHTRDRQLRTVDGAVDPGHARAHADIWLHEVTAGYGDREALGGVTLAIEPGSLLAIVGPNGAGKSTLLKLIAGLVRPWHGRIEVLGSPPGREAHRIAYVPQAELVDWGFPVTVGDVVMMGRFPRLGPIRRPGRGGPARGRRGARQGRHGGLRGDADRAAVGWPATARVPRSRACARSRTSSCSMSRSRASTPTSQEDLMDLLEAEARRGKTIVATTHDLATAAQQFHLVLAINHTVVAYGPASLILDPEVLSRAYGGHLLVLGGGAVVLDDAHHHDDAAPGEVHFHERGER